MQIYLEQRYLDNNIRNISKKSELDIVFEAPTSGSYFIYDSKGLSFIINADNPKKLLNVDFLTGKLGWRIKVGGMHCDGGMSGSPSSHSDSDSELSS